MITEKQITSLVEEFVRDTGLFLVDLTIRTGNRIAVFIDGDHGITVDDCRAVNHFLEEKLDRELHDFDLTVSSAGADRPLKLPRQYRKNIGRELEIVTGTGEKLTGKLMDAGDLDLVIEYTEKKSKKETALKTLTLPYTGIKSAKAVISFKK
jgi:ribosome maturation factor RimP